MQAANPYSEYTLYITYHAKEGRRYAVLVAKDHRTTISYARYALGVKLGRRLTEDEEADHIDNNRLNDNPDNLQILSKAKNISKSIKFKDYGTKICKVCGKEFPATRNKHIECCSRKCGGAASHNPCS